MQGMPTDWDRSEILTRFGKVGTIQNIHLVLNSTGQQTGKAILTYDKDESGEIAIQKFDNRAVEGLVCRVKPYFQKNQPERPRNDEELIQRRVYLMNVPYDATKTEIEDLIKPFAPIDQVVIPRDK